MGMLKCSFSKFIKCVFRVFMLNNHQEIKVHEGGYLKGCFIFAAN